MAVGKNLRRRLFHEGEVRRILKDLETSLSAKAVAIRWGCAESVIHRIQAGTYRGRPMNGCEKIWEMMAGIGK
jgi:hypothetical protein